MLIFRIFFGENAKLIYFLSKTWSYAGSVQFSKYLLLHYMTLKKKISQGTILKEHSFINKTPTHMTVKHHKTMCPYILRYAAW